MHSIVKCKSLLELLILFILCISTCRPKETYNYFDVHIISYIDII